MIEPITQPVPRGATSAEAEPKQPAGNSQLWENLYQLTSAVHLPDLETALDTALTVGAALTGANLLAVYRAYDNQPGFTLAACHGDPGLFPSELPAQELPHLVFAPRVWTSDKRPTSGLQRAARLNGLSYISSVLLGQVHAPIGLLVIADRQKMPDHDLVAMTQVLGASISALFQEFTHRENIHKQLNRLEHALNVQIAVDDTISEGLVMLSPDLKIKRVNPAAEMILGYGSPEVVGHPIETILVGTESIIPALNDAQKGKPTLSNTELRLYRRNGEAFPVHMRIVPVVFGEMLDSIVILIQDLSEKEQIQVHAQQLEQQAILGEITAVFAHDMRNPINNISTGLEFLESVMPADNPNRQELERMQQDCDRLGDMMKSLLTYARPTEFDAQPVDVHFLVKRLIDRLHPRLVNARIKENFYADPECPQVAGNVRALEQVFSNLITNAIEAMSAANGNGLLTIHIRPIQTPEKRTFVEVSIADNGPGIPKESQEKIFQPFYSTSRNGTGLGLAITKRIVTAHKGLVRVSSFPGGSLFQVHLPALK